jgi:hypothetical protein
MATPSGVDEIFRKSLERFKIGLNTHEKEDFALTTLDDVHDTIDKIQRMYGSERKMQNMARLQGFLEGMEQYGTLIEVFLNVSVFVAFVWVGFNSCDGEMLQDTEITLGAGKVPASGK